MNNILLIDTTSNKEIKIGISRGRKDYFLKQKINHQKAQAVLPMIGKLLKKQGLGLEDLSLIEVNTGPGSFTGIRVGMAIANALSFALKIPVKMI